MDIREIILNERQAKGWTQKQLADKAGVQQSLIARCEAGQSEPKFSTGISILLALGYDLSKLSTIENKPQESSIDELSYKLKGYIKAYFDTSTEQISYYDYNPYTKDVEEKKAMALVLTANNDFNLDNIVFTKGDSLKFLHSEAVTILEEIENNIRSQQKKALSETCTQVTKNYFKAQLISHLVVNQRLNERHNKPYLDDKALKDILNSKSLITVKEILESTYSGPLAWEDEIGGLFFIPSTATEKPEK